QFAAAVAVAAPFRVEQVGRVGDDQVEAAGNRIAQTALAQLQLLGAREQRVDVRQLQGYRVDVAGPDLGLWCRSGNAQCTRGGAAADLQGPLRALRTLFQM